jgi:hypothetical protein
MECGAHSDLFKFNDCLFSKTTFFGPEGNSNYLVVLLRNKELNLEDATPDGKAD